MPHERRLSIRKTPEQIAYISLPLNNGGIVLDVSVGGLGFHSIAPVETDAPIQFQFAVDSATRIEAVGELAWKDETGKTGGLRFTQLPDDIREHIRVWSGQPKASVLDIPVAEPEVEAGIAASGQADSALVAERERPLLYNLRPPVYSAPFNEFSMFPLESDYQARATAAAPQGSFPSRHPIAALLLTIFLASVVASAIFAYVSTSQAGDVLYYLEGKIRDGFHSQSILKSTAPPASSAPNSSKTFRQ